jgi:hypothetical protein
MPTQLDRALNSKVMTTIVYSASLEHFHPNTPFLLSRTSFLDSLVLLLHPQLGPFLAATFSLNNLILLVVSAAHTHDALHQFTERHTIQNPRTGQKMR